MLGCEGEGEWVLVAVAYLSLSGKGRGGRLFEAGRLLTFSASRMGAYSRWALIRGWALIRINTVCGFAGKRTIIPKRYTSLLNQTGKFLNTKVLGAK